MGRYSIYLLLLCQFIVIYANESVTVSTHSGPVEGEVCQTSSGFNVNAFRGIPYAKPPVGELRFKKPEKVEPWTDSLKTTSWPSRCLYMMLDPSFKQMLPGEVSEDCLYLNIFAPSQKSDKFPHGYPVMFWVHGGGFVLGGTEEYGMDGINEYMVTKEVIVVTIQYRLSFLGFYTTGDGKALGNYGLWDQALALTWVKENIGVFGGNPDLITVYGESAGGASVSILSISPHTSDKFQYAIPMSGSVYNDWAVRPDSQPVVDHCALIAKALGCKGSSEETIECLRKLSGEQIEDTTAEVQSGFKEMIFRLGPVFDGDFFPKDMDTLFAEAPKKPTMAGVMDYEGILWVIPFFPMETPYVVYNMTTFNYDQLTKKVDKLLSTRNYQNHDLIKSLVLHQFVDSKGDISDWKFLLKQWSEIAGDDMITKSIVKENNIRLDNDWPVWFYNFEYFNPALYPEGIEFEGAYHASELTFIFGKSVFNMPFELGENDLKLIDITTTLWTNFAKYGNPTPEPVDGVKWEKRTKDKPFQYLNINVNLEMKDSYRRYMDTFWHKLVADIENMGFVWKKTSDKQETSHTEL